MIGLVAMLVVGSARHRIEAAGIQGMAARDAPQRQPQAHVQAVRFERFESVL